MINRLRLLRNIGKFDSADSSNIPLTRLALIYAENGRGKTTLAAILRSLATSDPIPIAERHRLAAQHPPHVIIDCDGGPQPAIFSNNAWNRTLPNMTVFDDTFIAENVCSGLDVGPDHRQHLHELILGSQGVTLNNQLQQLVVQIEVHNAALRTKAAAIPTSARGPYPVDDFCGLPARVDIDDAILSAERNLAAAREQDPVRNTPAFDTLSLPNIDVAELNGVLQLDLPALDAAAAGRVQAHLARIGGGGERWVADGMGRIPQTGAAGTTAAEICPFCAQDLSRSEVINHYRAYFSSEYSSLKQRVSEAIDHFNRMHGGMAAAAFERAVRVAVERQQFWSRFSAVPEVAIDTARIAHDWRTASQLTIAKLMAKQGAPLESDQLTDQARTAIAAYEVHRETIATLNQELQRANATVAIVKEQALVANPTTIAGDVARLKAVGSRHTSEIAALCQDYLNEKNAKARTEQQRDQVRTALDRHRTNVFPGYQTAINEYLRRFNAGFRLARMTSANTRSGSTCTYNVIINNTPISIAGGVPIAGQPSFRNTLSAGDRNTLALAFFFASLDQDPALANKVVVIDDPISSLDDHRSLTTVQEIRRLADRAGQVIALSHTKPFLCRLWEGADTTVRTALHLVRDGDGTSIGVWDVNQDSITEHDRRHAVLREYLSNGTPNNREVAAAIRPLLEAFLRVACPEHFVPGLLLGPFRNLCEQRVGSPRQVMDNVAIQELRDLTEYANRFHHDTNPAWQTEIINDGELAGFVRRALDFARA